MFMALRCRVSSGLVEIHLQPFLVDAKIIFFEKKQSLKSMRRGVSGTKKGGHF